MTRRTILFALLLLASCIEIEDASDKKKATADSASGALDTSAARAVADSTAAGRAAAPDSALTAYFGPDSATFVRGAPLDTAGQGGALPEDSARAIAPLDTVTMREMRAGAWNPATLAGQLIVPVRGIAAADLRDTYDESRGGGTRAHEALDIPAPRGTPVVSAVGGRVLKLFDSKAGGNMVYAADSSERFILMYGHLDSYAPGLAEGQPLARGQVIGTVGTTGNAPPNLPHLHFAIARSDDVKVWWKGEPVNPYPLLRR
jgi:murein DD-endopeptidase MepM/ murein hydrolase activator NlpD